MALAVTHVLVVIIILELFRYYVFEKDKFPRYLVVIGGIAGLVPDVDIPLGWFLSLVSGTTVYFHGLFTHSIFFVLLFLALAFIRHYQDDQKWAKIFAVIAVGWFFHLVLDCFYGGFSSTETKLFLWPLTIMPSFCPSWNVYLFAPHIDAILLVVWLIHEEIHGYIKKYV
ncbi:MAG: metal-dependent hydrolase [Nanoarchaeota archaeon]|nr:metal-dependent hydrolase [Nanoarchaeota archaeon]